jgi:hypothetical protein
MNSIDHVFIVIASLVFIVIAALKPTSLGNTCIKCETGMR